ncbi:GNAT family N-acetyltransferase [Acidisphaera sp. L21]|uniref:GNAT family N-acetyltransferase n=1 Tax=Acidisphaera sp. L21 TaxID=1641851 RepID=UPI00131E0231|nr:GNAT family N-acetyltransferase [Acidisphaera sp. L21]
MIRRATEDDIPRINQIRNSVTENRLSSPSLVTPTQLRWFIDNPGIYLWLEAGTILGFSAADPRDGSIWALFMDPAHQGRGIARTLFARACLVLKETGHKRIWLMTQPGTRAERFYLAAGWERAGMKNGQVLFEADIGRVT